MGPRRKTRISRSETRRRARHRARDEADEALVARARVALVHAYSPYSNRRFGAALLASDGRVFTGCNVENASFGLTLCAERTALAKAVSEGVRSFVAMAVATDRKEPLMPCGACRQMLSEFAPSLRLVIAGSGRKRRRSSLRDLLPYAFGAFGAFGASGSLGLVQA